MCMFSAINTNRWYTFWEIQPRQLTFQMLTLQQKYLYHHSQYSRTCDSKCLALITQVVRAFGMKVRVPLKTKHFLSLKFRHFHKSESKMNAVAHVQLTFQMFIHNCWVTKEWSHSYGVKEPKVSDLTQLAANLTTCYVYRCVWEEIRKWYSVFFLVFIAVTRGGVSIRKTVLPGMAIPMLKIRRPNGRLIFNMEIAIRR